MTYRNDLTAANSRIHSLEQELAEARGHNASKPSRRSARASKPLTLGSIRYHRPQCYTPLLALWWESAKVSLACVWPNASDISDISEMCAHRPNNVIAWLAYKLIALPLAFILFLAYYAGLLVLLPGTAMFSAVASVAFLPIVLMRGLQFSDVAPPKRSWFDGNPSSESYQRYPTDNGSLVSPSVFALRSPATTIF